VKTALFMFFWTLWTIPVAILGVAYAQNPSPPVELDIGGQVLSLPIGDLTFPGSIVVVGYLLIKALPTILERWTPTVRFVHVLQLEELDEEVVAEVKKRIGRKKPAVAAN
jgi:hypothetical protein